MIRTVGGLLAVLLLLAATMSAARAEKRVALVIGNTEYAHVTNLRNPANDAKDLTAALQRIGFVVKTALNLGYSDTRRALRDFAREANGADMAIVFFAGHGMEVDKQNYLIPVDARLEEDRDVFYEAIPLDLAVASVEGARGLRMILLDACRNNPFAASMKMTSTTRSVGRGLERIEPAKGTLVGYAAKAGTTADDGDGRNSPYTAALLKHLDEPDLEINFLFRKVRDSVVEATNGQQVPFTYGSLPGKRIYLNKTAPAKAVAVPKPEPAPETPRASVSRSESLAAEMLHWNTVKDSADLELLQTYLDEYPKGRFARIAKVLIKKVSKAKAPQTPEPAQGQAPAPAAEPEPEPRVALVAPDMPLDDRASVSDVQRSLYELSYDPGPADGVAGAKTRTAIRAFQTDNGLAPDGEVTSGLLQALRDTPVPKNWGALGFAPATKAVAQKSGLSSRSAAENAIRRACPGCRESILVFAGRECAALAYSSRGWGWAVRKGLGSARKSAMEVCAQYGGGCQIRSSVCADGS